MFQRVLIANRGEIAVRLMRACKALGLTSVFFYPPGIDTTIEQHVADESYCLKTKDPYACFLSIEFILRYAKKHRIDAIHPGYGFLSENAEFSQACADNKITFIGGTGDVLEKTGNKIITKQIAKDLNIPILPYSQGLKTLEETRKELESYTFPVLLKASWGGGGKGLILLHSLDQLDEQFEQAQIQAKEYFIFEELFLEQYVEKVKHIEFQVARDKQGNTICFGERECSIQRKYQKLIEESPSPTLSQQLRDDMTETAKKLIQEIGLVGLATIEYLVTQDDDYYFLEINPRIQVEHGVTELVTGIDLALLQLLLAQGEEMPLKQEDVIVEGHAIQCRIVAEDPFNNFLPSLGKIVQYKAPGGCGVRVDDALYSGFEVSPYFDSLIAKVMTYGLSREEAIMKMLVALEEAHFDGIATTIPLYQQILQEEGFLKGIYTTDYLHKQKFTAKHSNKKLALPSFDEDTVKQLIAEVTSAIYSHMKKTPHKRGKHKSMWKFDSDFHD